MFPPSGPQLYFQSVFLNSLVILTSSCSWVLRVSWVWYSFRRLFASRSAEEIFFSYSILLTVSFTKKEVFSLSKSSLFRISSFISAISYQNKNILDLLALVKMCQINKGCNQKINSYCDYYLPETVQLFLKLLYSMDTSHQTLKLFWTGNFQNIPII